MKTEHRLRIIGYIFIAAAFAVFALIGYANNPGRQVPQIFSPHTELSALWENYKKNFIENESGRTVDTGNGNITTSEGESYTMLRAVWMDDRATFDKSWTWTKNNMQRPDGLFSWLFGKKTDGSYGVLTRDGGTNSATDADSDIALALVFAYGRWGDSAYLDDAQKVIDAIWKNEVVIINKKPYLASNNVERLSNGPILVNPSYFSPYSYRIFAFVDPFHNWNGLVETSYAILKETLDSKMDKEWSAGLPPDWVRVDRKTGSIIGNNDHRTYFGYDAIRVPWRIALDWIWFSEPRAKEILGRMKFIGDAWNSDKKLVMWNHDGTVLEDRETPARYGTLIGYFIVADPEKSAEVYTDKLTTIFDPDSMTWKTPLGYYDDNWAWFGIAMYNNMLPNLFDHQQS